MNHGEHGGRGPWMAAGVAEGPSWRWRRWRRKRSRRRGASTKEAQAQLSEAHERKTAALKKQRLDDISEASRTLEAEVGKVKASFDKMKVDPWTVEGKIDYQKLINELGSQLISPELLARIEKLTVGKGRAGCRTASRPPSSRTATGEICDLVEKADAAGYGALLPLAGPALLPRTWATCCRS